MILKSKFVCKLYLNKSKFQDKKYLISLNALIIIKGILREQN